MNPVARLFDSNSLIPAEWLVRGARYRAFNPTLAPVDGGYVMAYRVVDALLNQRRIAICRLTPDFALVPDSITPLSDAIRFADIRGINERAQNWHADPRLFALKGDIYVLWNDGANRPSNNQFLVQLSPATLQPEGPARKIVSDAAQRTIEKSWMFFEHAGETFAVYSIAPFRILKVNLSDANLVKCSAHSELHWGNDYTQLYGVVRGGAQPVAMPDGALLAIAHSSYKTAAGRRYVACAYRFRMDAPDADFTGPDVPIELPNPVGTRFDLPKLNVDVSEVTYPCGACLAGDRIVFSYGLNDERCMIAALPVDDVLATLKKASTHATVSFAALPYAFDGSGSRGRVRVDALPRSSSFTGANNAAIPLFWWDAAGKKFDGALGSRKFAVGNFGDIASRSLIERLTENTVREPRPGERKLLSIGSVLHRAADGDIVWGSGAKGSVLALAKGVRHLDVYAVRGPLTFDFLRRSGIYTGNIAALFDPGCLIPHLFKTELGDLPVPSANTDDYKIVPHYRDDLALRRSHVRLRSKFVTVDADPLAFVRSIAGANRVISSSLHGIIFAEAMGIPAVWLAPLGGQDEFKYYDYYFGTGRFQVARATDLDEALRLEPTTLPTFDVAALAATFPAEAVAALPFPALPCNKPIRFGTGEAALAGVSHHGFDYAGAEGIWGVGKEARLEFRIADRNPGDCVLHLTIRPFNPAAFHSPQELVIALGDSRLAHIRWQKGDQTRISIEFGLTEDIVSEPIRLRMLPRNFRSPKSLGITTIDQQIAFCLSELSIAARGLLTARPSAAAANAAVESVPDAP